MPLIQFNVYFRDYLFVYFDHIIYYFYGHMLTYYARCDV